MATDRRVITRGFFDDPRSPHSSGALRSGFFLGGVLVVAGANLPAWSQPILTDNSLGRPQSFDGVRSRIGAELGLDAFPNLLHSFMRFNIPTQGEVTFTGEKAFANILVRVTGSEVSQIDGTLGTDIPGANLFLINPRGIVFGPSAKLDLTGSFAATTADRVLLQDGAEIPATATTPTVILTAPPAAFGFLGRHSGVISAHGSQLAVATGQSLSLVAHEIALGQDSDTAIGSKLCAPQGEITLATVGPDREFPVHPTSAGALPLPHPDAGLIQISGGSSVDVGSPPQVGEVLCSATSPSMTTEANSRGPASIWIRGGRLVLKDRDSTLRNPALGTDHDGRIDVDVARDLVVENRATITADSFHASGAGRQVELRAQSITIDNARIETGTYAGGDGAHTGLQAHEITLRNGARITSQSYDEATGQGGRVRIDAEERLTLESGARVNLDTYANSPDALPPSLTISAGQMELLGTGEFRELDTGLVGGTAAGTAPGASIKVSARTLSLQDGASIRTDTFTRGTAGDIQVTARRLALGDAAAITSEAHDEGSAGNITIEVQESLTLDHSSPAEAPPTIRVDAPSSSGAGNIVLSSQGILSIKSGTLSASGAGGNIDLTGGEQVLIAAQTRILAENSGRGGGGNIRITSRGRVNLSDSTLSARSTGSSSSANGGNIEIPAPATDDSWPGSPIPQEVVLNGAKLDASATQGSGGNVRIAAQAYVSSADSVIDLRGGTGIISQPETPEFSLQPPPDPPKSQTTFDTPPLLEAVTPEALDDPEGYTRVGYRATRPLAVRRRLTLGPPIKP